MILPLPSPVFEAFWRFAAERHAIFQRRSLGRPGPWTADPILQTYKFTNSYRVLDRVTQTLVREVINPGSRSADDVFLRILLYKVFNRESTWRMISAELGEPRADNFSDQLSTLEDLLTEARCRGERIYSSAYIMPPVPGSAREKHRGHLAMLRSMLERGVPGAITKASSLKEVYLVLRAQAGLGDFLAFQFAIDLNYSDIIPFGEEEFVVAGPGARDGISKCFVNPPLGQSAEIIMAVYRQQAEWFDRYNIAFDGLQCRPLMPIDIQNLFCEISKYARVAFPAVIGSSGRTKIKQNYRMSGPLPPVTLPRKWNSSGSSTVLGNQPWTPLGASLDVVPAAASRPPLRGISYAY